MNRRAMLTSLAVAVPAIVATGASAAQPKKYGAVTVEGHSKHIRMTGETLHVWLNGEDVTWSCGYANDIDGVVHLYPKTSEQYKRWLVKGGIHNGHFLEVRGDVVIAPGERS